MCRRIAAIKFNEIRADLVGSHHTVISHRTLRNQITNTELFDHVRKLGVSRGCWRRVSNRGELPHANRTNTHRTGYLSATAGLDLLKTIELVKRTNFACESGIARFEKLTWNLSDEVA